MSLGERLKQAREEKGLTQIFAAKKLGIANTTLSGYENNDRKPDPNMLKKIAELYEVSPNWLLESGEKDDNGFDILREEMKKRGLSPKEVVERILRENKADRIEEVIKELRSIIVDNDYNKDL